MIAYIVLKLNKFINIESEKDKNFIEKIFPNKNYFIDEKYPEGFLGTIKIDNKNIVGIVWVYSDIETARNNKGDSTIVEVEVDEKSLEIIRFGEKT